MTNEELKAIEERQKCWTVTIRLNPSVLARPEVEMRGNEEFREAMADFPKLIAEVRRLQHEITLWRHLHNKELDGGQGNIVYPPGETSEVGTLNYTLDMPEQHHADPNA